jgi:osmoprotectant transport system substrate-binding protein
VNVRRAGVGVLAALVLSVGLVVGLGTGSASAGHAGSTTTTTAVTVPEPVVTTVIETTPTTQTLPGSNKPKVLLGDMNTPEQFIIGQLYTVALEAEGYKVIPYRNASAQSQDVGGLRNGHLDIFPEYLGLWNSFVAHSHRRFRSPQASYAAADAFAEHHGFVLLKPTPFSDTSCVAVLAQYAAANDVYSIPQLARRGPSIFGAPVTFEYSNDGLPALEHSYGLSPDYVEPIADGLQYWWLRTGNVDAAYCATTDPDLSGPKYVMLRNPKNIFGYGNVFPVTTQHVLQVEGKYFAKTIDKVDALLTLRAMRGLNAEIELGRHDPTAIATQFLEGNGILPPSRYAPVTTSTTSTTSTDT